MVYNGIMPVIFLDSASISEQSAFTLIQLRLVNKTMQHSKQLPSTGIHINFYILMRTLIYIIDQKLKSLKNAAILFNSCES